MASQERIASCFIDIKTSKKVHLSHKILKFVGFERRFGKKNLKAMEGMALFQFITESNQEA